MGNPHRDRQRRGGRGKDKDEFRNNGFGDAYQRRFGTMDVSIEGKGRRDRPPRPKLEFRELVCLEQGSCRCSITAAEGMNGRIYSFSVERTGKDRTTRFFRDTDATDLATLVNQAAEWIENDRRG